MQKIGWLILFLIFLNGCTFRADSRPSILIIAVESLGFDSVSCETAGFHSFCSESVRFTHAFAPSVMTQATLASILTGRYPYEHGVTHNGSEFLSARFETISEVAIKKGYQTSFFSGGPPVWRKSGLAQGFEVFDDFFWINLHKLYRPATETVNAFWDWLEEDDDRPFFSIVYLADLQFLDEVTENDLGELRERGYSGQLREIGESVESLISKMKKKRKWDNTFVILMGTNGHLSTVRRLETDAISLHSENTQVALFVKPAQKPRDNGVEWKIDRNVTLVDLGPTILDILGTPRAVIEDDELEVVNLKGVLYRPYVDWNPDRWLLSETAWPMWRGWGNTRWALRMDPYVFIHDLKPLLYNTLTDRRETLATPIADAQGNELLKRFGGQMQKLGFPPWVQPAASKIEKIQLGQRLWRELEATEDITKELNRLLKNIPQDRQLQGWKARLLLDKEQWTEFADFAKTAQKPLWKYVAEKNLRAKATLNREGCNKFFLEKKNEVVRPEDCDDMLLIALWRWIHEKDNGEKKHFQEAFLRNYVQAQMYERISKANFVNSLKWDVPVEMPGEPLLARLLLALPEHKKYLSITRQRLLREDISFDLSPSFEF